MLQSPDHSPSLINLLASDNSSSEESVRAYFARKVNFMEMEATKRSLTDSQRTIPKESESEAVTVTPATNTSSGEKIVAPDPADETHLGTQLQMTLSPIWDIRPIRDPE